jgi:hypothetical protein
MGISTAPNHDRARVTKTNPWLPAAMIRFTDFEPPTTTSCVRLHTLSLDPISVKPFLTKKIAKKYFLFQ